MKVEEYAMTNNDQMEVVLAKAQTLSEALPYIQKFNGAKIVVKYGGSAMLDDNLKFGKESEFVNGLRVTDEETLDVAEMVLSKVNKSLVAMMTSLGLKAVGISGKDAGLLKVKQKFSDGKDIGYVGEVTESNSELLDTLIEHDFIPVIAPIGLGEEDNHGYNINADDCACAIATAVNAEKLVFLTDIEGVFVDPSDKKTLISEMDIHEAQQWHDAKASELYRSHEKWCVPCSYS